jgi:shikimate dehydrogenase
VSAKPLNRECLTETIEGADIIINATPLGMNPKIEETPVARELLNPGIFVFDLVYNPPETRLLKEAEAAGARTLTGVRMLVYQGAEAFRLWTGKEAPEELMMREVEKALKGV